MRELVWNTAELREHVLSFLDLYDLLAISSINKCFRIWMGLLPYRQDYYETCILWSQPKIAQNLIAKLTYHVENKMLQMVHRSFNLQAVNPNSMLYDCRISQALGSCIMMLLQPPPWVDCVRRILQQSKLHVTHQAYLRWITLRELRAQRGTKRHGKWLRVESEHAETLEKDIARQNDSNESIFSYGVSEDIWFRRPKRRKITPPVFCKSQENT